MLSPEIIIGACRKMTEILYKSKDAIIIYKPAGVPSQSDPTGDKDAMTISGELLRLSGERDELYLIYRLDRVVGGLLIFARNKKCAAYLSRLVSEEGMGKEYIAVVDGVACDGVMKDYLYKDSKLGKAFVTDRARGGVKEAELEFRVIESVNVDGKMKSLVSIILHTGRFHQIRAQFSHRGMPLVGDGKYGSRDKTVRMPSLFAHKLELSIFGDKISVKRLPDMAEYPWNLFAKESYDIL